ncbi:tetratricopeptide repeat protein [Kitasatospora sp. NRRL B-11411]|uniref:tetratricopeptide repeat protein n=1 Tax=Kitasatospora sp. NRRL B-11411 TaxID=1463822 RepID=UPI0004C45BE5|nr:tetratricopeptide repeat protein [Kitasatospora sp. NRRL B-11411]
MGLFSHRKTGRAAGILHEAQQAREKGDFPAAERLGRRAAGLYAEAVGSGAHQTAAAEALVGAVVHAQGRGEEAERGLRAALAVAGLTADGEVLLRADLANVLRKEGRYQEAVQEIRTALALRGKSELRLSVRQSCALLLGELGQHREAAEQFAALVADTGRGTPQMRTFAAAMESNLLTQLIYLGEHAEADRLVAGIRERAATGWEPEATLTRVSAANSRALSLCLRGRHAEAEELLRQGLAAGPSREQFVQILNVNLVRALLGQGRVEEAGQALDTALAAAGKLPAPSDHDRSSLGLATANLRLAQGDAAGAGAAAREGLALCPPSRKPTHRALELRTALGTAETRQGRGTDTLTAALADWEEHFGPAHHGAAAARDALAAPAG